MKNIKNIQMMTLSKFIVWHSVAWQNCISYKKSNSIL